jgi:hypothetical protein
MLKQVGDTITVQSGFFVLNTQQSIAYAIFKHVLLSVRLAPMEMNLRSVDTKVLDSALGGRESLECHYIYQNNVVMKRT